MSAEPTENWMIALGFVAIGGLLAAATWLNNYLKGRGETSMELAGPRHIVLEHAELGNFAGLKTQLTAIETKLGQVFGLVEDLDDDFKTKADEQLQILRKMEREIDVAHRLREERILGAERQRGGHHGNT